MKQSPFTKIHFLLSLHLSYLLLATLCATEKNHACNLYLEMGGRDSYIYAIVVNYRFLGYLK